uniref:RING-type domain-containing protein n=1 Tax=Macrostomum lignano TaxID=282301 RepID=A0A1I8F1A0_9PLAT
PGQFTDSGEDKRQQQLQLAAVEATNGSAVLDCEVADEEVNADAQNDVTDAAEGVRARIRGAVRSLLVASASSIWQAGSTRRTLGDVDNRSERRRERQTPAVDVLLSLFMRVPPKTFRHIKERFFHCLRIRGDHSRRNSSWRTRLSSRWQQPEEPPIAAVTCVQVQLLVHLLFILLQTFHLFKRPQEARVVVSVYPSAVKFALAHLIVTNLCIWMKAVIFEVKMALTKNLLDHPTGALGSNRIQREMRALLQCPWRWHSEAAPSHSLSPFLYPCAVEYGLISAAICFKLFKKVGAEYADAEACRYDLPRPACSFGPAKSWILIVVPLATLVLLPQRTSRKRDAYTIAVLSGPSAASCSSPWRCARCCSYQSIRNLTLTSRDVHLLDVNLLFVAWRPALLQLVRVVSSASCLMDEHQDELETDHCLFGSGRRPRWRQAFLIAALSKRKLSRKLFLQGRKPARAFCILCSWPTWPCGISAVSSQDATYRGISRELFAHERRAEASSRHHAAHDHIF